ncbi:NeuD/PglB/VioB family sugar acetyltransferase [Enterobacter mori]|nr:NeuD/PglB/VioB family sugar acetyltransferase [Enterobacter mori]
MNNARLSGYVLIGSGGHSRVLAEIVQKNNKDICCLVTLTPPDNNGIFSDAVFLSDNDFIKQYDNKDVILVNGIGQVPYNRTRESIYKKYTRLGYKFGKIISTNSVVSSFSSLSDGVQILTGAIIQYGAKIGSNSIVNTGAIVEHDSIIGDNCHIAPGSVICGDVRIGHSTIIGAGATVIQGVTIGNNCIIGAGAVITKDISSSNICYPARIHIEKIASEKMK